MKHTKSIRNRHLSRIHALASELDLTETAYRNILAALTGERSAANLSESDRMVVVGFLARKIASRSTPQAPTFEQTEIVTDDEALSILGMAA